MYMPLIVSFPGTEQTTLVEVGGKGHSLIRMIEAGLPVPPGADNPVWSSPSLGPGDVYEVTFDAPGKFTYHCVPHPFMRGTIVVR